MRRAAAGMLADVRGGRALERARSRTEHMSPEDGRFADAMTRVALRRHGEIDAALGPFLKRPIKAGPTCLAHPLLHVGAAQILFLDVPVHAAVNETVAAAGGARERPFRSLINAVLRRLAESRHDRRPDPRLNVPTWLYERLATDFGPETADGIAAVVSATPSLDLCFKSAREADRWTCDVAATDRLTASHVRLAPRHGPVPDLPGFSDGTWWVQDVAAGFPVTLLAEVLPPRARVLDACAAPGGKTLQLAAAGYAVTALDISDVRLDVLRANLRRTRLSALTIVADASEWRPTRPYDAVLLDPPCCASGTIRRHPDLLVSGHRDATRDARIALQDRLLDQAATWIDPGGFVMFSTCSLDHAEGEDRVAAFLARNERFRVRPSDRLPERLTRNGMLRTTPATWSDRGGMDGFFAALLEKTPPARSARADRAAAAS